MSGIHDQLAQAILSTQSDAILLVDPSGIIRFWNPGATRIFGFTAEEAIGGPLDLIVPENLRARHNEGFARTMASGKTRYGAGEILAVPAMTKGGRRISVEFTIVLLFGDSGRLTGCAAVMRDVTARFEELRTLRRQLKAAAQPAG